MPPRDALELATDRAVLDACDRAGLRRDDAFHVKDLMRRSPASWPACCGAGCRPCSEDLICAAMIAQRTLREAERAAAEETVSVEAVARLAGER